MEKHKFRFKNPLFSIDASTIDLCLNLFPWAEFRKAKDFLGEVKVEVKKVTWPSRKDAMGGTMVVVVVVVIMSIFLGVIDTLLSKIVEALISG